MLKNRMKNPFNKKIKDQKPQFVNYNSRNEEAIEEEFDEEEAIEEEFDEEEAIEEEFDEEEAIEEEFDEEEAIEEEFDEEEAIAEDLIYEKNDQTNISKSPKSWSARLKNIYSKI